MRVASTAELKNRTNELVRTAMAGEPVVITIYGRPAAALTPLHEGAIAEILLERHGRELLGPEPVSPLKYVSVEAPIGTVYVAFSEHGVVHVDLAPADRAFEQAVEARFGRRPDRNLTPAPALLRQIKVALTTGKEFTGPVDLSAVGPFERLVLDELKRIPRGQVRTYRDIAARVGHPTATRAVGNACAKNPIPLLIPCHRVVRSDGGLGGYSLRGGAALKRKLLEREGAKIATIGPKEKRTDVR